MASLHGPEHQLMNTKTTDRTTTAGADLREDQPGANPVAIREGETAAERGRREEAMVLKSLVADRLNRMDAMRPQMEPWLRQAGIQWDAFISGFRLAMAKNPKIARCTPASLILGCMDSARLGLPPGEGARETETRGPTPKRRVRNLSVAEIPDALERRSKQAAPRAPWFTCVRKRGHDSPSHLLLSCVTHQVASLFRPRAARLPWARIGLPEPGSQLEAQGRQDSPGPRRPPLRPGEAAC